MEDRDTETQGLENAEALENPVAAAELDEAELMEAESKETEPKETEPKETEPAGVELNEAELNDTIAELCLSKAEEFKMIGYDQVTGADVWECVSDKYHKKGVPPLHVIVNDILSLKITQFMNYITLSMYRGEVRK